MVLERRKRGGLRIVLTAQRGVFAAVLGRELLCSAF